MTMPNLSANLPAAKIINRILRDYPQARQRLGAHQDARIDIHLGPLSAALRITGAGGVEPVGEGADAAHVTFRVPLAAIPRLLKKDESANHNFGDIAFEGDSELAHLLSTVARAVEWDIEEDLSQLLGGNATADMVAHRIVGGMQSFAARRDEAGQRFSENVAEYLLHERDAFVGVDELEQLARANETLRDDVARLEARCAKLLRQ